ncbi:hypothetical protein TorRG33x02_348590 [Trema orientale]|uniref:Uncharacterized protein n=1 Tax=Trema orientale TaxID=63057 RepID=A0A2P5AJT8_TREOI|nr:hypothetical protein TorRG33x02_348590 [Trema orientale]
MMKNFAAFLALFMVLLSTGQATSDDNNKAWNLCKGKKIHNAPFYCKQPECSQLCGDMHPSIRGFGSCRSEGRIWNECNRIFQQRPRDITTIVEFVNTFLLELQVCLGVSSLKEACLPPSPQRPRDITTIVEFVNTFLLKLQVCLGVSSLKEACLPPSPVKWKASPSEGLKMNTDASLRNGVGFVELGAV